MKKLHLTTLAIAGLLVFGTVFTACNKDKFDDNNNNENVAGLMAFNLAPEKSVSFTISGNWLNNLPLAYTNYTGAYVPIYPGTRPVASFDYASGDTLATASFDFAVQKYYSVFTIGANNNFQNVIVHDNFDSLSASNGKAYIRYINAIAGSASPNVKVTAGGTDVVNTGAAYGSVSDFVAVTPGSVTIAVTEGSTINANRTITTEDKKVYTVLLIPGATSAEPAQIKYITNGQLEDDATQRTSSARSATIN